ncbi:MAG TPA: orotate phosphoribosyltransferase [Dehalococcoidia bacterium]|nr:orotate phosphoribosyltransferase [Dehalococcoidia bacterium]
MTTSTLLNEQSRLREILDAYCIRRGEFVLAAGGRSSYFFQGKFATLSPEGARLTGELVFERLRGQGIEAVGGKALGADPIATAVALTSGLHGEPLPAFIVRPQRKDHGIEDLIAESYAPDGKPLISPGRRVAIVDDVATSGRSCMDAVDAVKAAGCEIAKIVVLVDRQQGAAEFFAKQGYPFEALFVADASGNLSNA